MSEAAPRLSKAALITFLLSVSSLLLSLATALPALYLGVQAIRAINRGEGRLRGHRLAIAGLVLSAFVTLVTVLGTAALLLLYAQEKSQAAGCTNNLRQIGAVDPALQRSQRESIPARHGRKCALKPEQRLSWQTAILPFLTQGGKAGKKWEKLADKIAVKEAWGAPANAGLRQNVAPFLCPAFAHELCAGSSRSNVLCRRRRCWRRCRRPAPPRCATPAFSATIAAFERPTSRHLSPRRWQPSKQSKIMDRGRRVDQRPCAASSRTAIAPSAKTRPSADFIEREPTFCGPTAPSASSPNKLSRPCFVLRRIARK